MEEVRKILLNKHLDAAVFSDLSIRRPGSAPPQAELLPQSPSGNSAAAGGLGSDAFSHASASAAFAPPIQRNLSSAAEEAAALASSDMGLGLSLDDEKFRSDPKYVAYYYANRNINPRLPPPLYAGTTKQARGADELAYGANQLNLLLANQLGLKESTPAVPIPVNSVFSMSQSLSASPPGVVNPVIRQDSFNSAHWGHTASGNDNLEALLSAFGSPKTTFNPLLTSDLKAQASNVSVYATNDEVLSSAPHTPHGNQAQNLFEQLVGSSSTSRPGSVDGRTISKDPKVGQPGAVGRVASIIGERPPTTRTPSKLRVGSLSVEGSGFDSSATGPAAQSGSDQALGLQDIPSLMAAAASDTYSSQSYASLNVQALTLPLDQTAGFGADGLLAQPMPGMVPNPQQMQAMYMAMYNQQQQLQGLQAMAQMFAPNTTGVFPGYPAMGQIPGMSAYPNMVPPGMLPLYAHGMEGMMAAAAGVRPTGGVPTQPGVMPPAYAGMGPEWAGYYQKMMEMQAAAALAGGAKDGPDSLQGMLGVGGVSGPNSRDRKPAGAGGDADMDMDRRARNGPACNGPASRAGSGGNREPASSRARNDQYSASTGGGNSPMRDGRGGGSGYTHSRLRGGDGLPDDPLLQHGPGRSSASEFRDSPHRYHHRDRDGDRGRGDRDSDRRDSGERHHHRNDREGGHYSRGAPDREGHQGHQHRGDRDMLMGRGGEREAGGRVHSPANSRRNSRRDDHAERRAMDPVLDEFKSNKARKFEFPDIKGHVYEFALDQHGSRFIQQKIESVAAADLAWAFEEVLPRCLNLMTDVFGNYVVQKFLEHGSEAQRLTLAKVLQGHVLALSLQMYGCRVVQKAVEVLPEENQVAIVAELDGHIMRCVRDQNGNHVIQKVIECVPTPRITHVLDNFMMCVVPLSTHPFGCRIIQRILEHCKDTRRRGVVMTEITKNVPHLAQDQYGNYVIQHVLEHGTSAERMEVVNRIAPQIVPMSMHKFASNVVERCLTHCGPEERQVLLAELLGPGGSGSSSMEGAAGGPEGEDALQAMMKDQFGNYVVQKVLEVCSDDQREMLLARVRAQLHALKKYTYGKHIVARVEKLLSAGTKYQAHARGRLLPDDMPGGPAAYFGTASTSGTADDAASVLSQTSGGGGGGGGASAAGADDRSSACAQSESGATGVTSSSAPGSSEGHSARASADMGQHPADDGLPLTDPVTTTSPPCTAIASALAKVEDVAAASEGAH